MRDDGDGLKATIRQPRPEYALHGLSFYPPSLSLTNLPPLFFLLSFSRSADAYVLQLTFPTTTLSTVTFPPPDLSPLMAFWPFWHPSSLRDPLRSGLLALNLIVKFRHSQLAVLDVLDDD